MNMSPTTALARAEQQLELYADDPAWQKLWLSLESETWRSLAIIPAGGLSSIDLVHGLAAVAWHRRGTPVIVADLRTIGLPALDSAREELRRRVENGERILIVTQALNKSATTATIAREADKVLLCVYLGHTSRSEVKDAVRELGAQRYLGSIVIRAGTQ